MIFVICTTVPPTSGPNKGDMDASVLESPHEGPTLSSLYGGHTSDEGLIVGNVDGTLDGVELGFGVGLEVGFGVGGGLGVGLEVGFKVGIEVGLKVGCIDDDGL